MSFDAGRDVVRALCVFYYEKSELGEKVRNRMRNVAVKWENAITGKGKKLPNLVIEIITPSLFVKSLHLLL